ncbi:hypothetical protein [Micromonospora sp. NPDC005220]|uniref:hypothetical protein n=1 Tax=Micromonospora sp. NPDC005220 TaxID=3155589 RepID=UPI0033A0F4EA
MAVLESILTSAGGGLSAVVGVVAGAVLTHRAQNRHWLRDRQLAAYQELLRQYATFTLLLKSAHWARSDWKYDWSVWSAALTSASLVAPIPVAREIENFGAAIGGFLAKAAVDARTDALTEEEFAAAMREPIEAQLALVNAIRRSLGREQGPLSTALGSA